MNGVVCSHGFGVDKTGRGLFTDIAAAFPELSFDMFDYNLVDAQGNSTVPTLPEQAATLNEHLKAANERVTLLCHSQGCVVAGMVDLTNVDKVIFLAPPDNLEIARFAKIFGRVPGAEYNPDATSFIPRRDGSRLLVPKEYLDSIREVNVMELYKKVGEQCDLTIIRAEDDELVGNTVFPDIKAHIVTIPGDHNFRYSFRACLIAKLQAVLAS